MAHDEITPYDMLLALCLTPLWNAIRLVIKTGDRAGISQSEIVYICLAAAAVLTVTGLPSNIAGWIFRCYLATQILIAARLESAGVPDKSNETPPPAVRRAVGTILATYLWLVPIICATLVIDQTRTAPNNLMIYWILIVASMISIWTDNNGGMRIRFLQPLPVSR